ncbi:MAG: hypothetical protein ABI528_02070 [bacterium]
MQKNFRYLLLVIPILFLISGLMLKFAQGPYYLNFYDPSYVYLINSLNLAQGFGVGHFDHPGTTVQTIGAVIVKLNYLLNGKENDIVIDVFSRPEEYLGLENTVFAFINFSALLLLGILTYRFSKNLKYALLLQLTPFVSMEIFYGFIIVTPDNFLIPLSLGMIGLLVYYLYHIDPEAKTPYRFIVLASILCGMGMATKLNFLPLILLPFFIIKGLKSKLLFIAYTVAAFFFFLLPALSNFSLFAGWVGKLFLYSGHYGQGEATVVSSSEFFPNLLHIIKKDIFFTATYLTLLVSVILSVFRKHIVTDSSEAPAFSYKKNKLLILTFIAMTFQIFLVAKQYRQHYMIPSFMLSVFSLSLSVPVILSYFRKSLKYSYAIIGGMVIIWGFVYILLSYNEGTMQKNDAYRIDEYIKQNYPDDFIISTFSTANIDAARTFGVYYAGSQADNYKKVLSKIQKQTLFFDMWIDRFYGITTDSDFRKVLAENKDKKVIVQIPHYDIDYFLAELDKVNGTKNSTSRKVYTAENGECVFEVTVGN